MSPSPRGAGRPVTLAGLRLILLMFAGFLLATMLFAALGRCTFGASDPGAQGPLLAFLGLMVVLESLGFFLLRIRLRQRWLAELESAPYQPGGPVPSNFAASAIIGGSFAEGLGIFGALVYLMTGDFRAMGAAGLAFLLILALLPREESLKPTPTRETP